jgi:hypothetical protein
MKAKSESRIQPRCLRGDQKSKTPAANYYAKERNSIGYETDPNLLPTIKKKIDGLSDTRAIDLKMLERKR